MTGFELDPLLHTPLRLHVCALLSAADEVEFAVVRAETGVSDSVLSKHVKQLEEAGYVHIRKATLASRQRTWLSLTAEGTRALAGYFAAIRGLAARVPNISE